MEVTQLKASLQQHRRGMAANETILTSDQQVVSTPSLGLIFLASIKDLCSRSAESVDDLPTSCQPSPWQTLY